jgi:hypothetical protein
MSCSCVDERRRDAMALVAAAAETHAPAEAYRAITNHDAAARRRSPPILTTRWLARI